MQLPASCRTDTAAYLDSLNRAGYDQRATSKKFQKGNPREPKKPTTINQPDSFTRQTCGVTRWPSTQPENLPDSLSENLRGYQIALPEGTPEKFKTKPRENTKETHELTETNRKMPRNRF